MLEGQDETRTSSLAFHTGSLLLVAYASACFTRPEHKYHWQLGRMESKIGCVTFRKATVVAQDRTDSDTPVTSIVFFEGIYGNAISARMHSIPALPIFFLEYHRRHKCQKDQLSYTNPSLPYSHKYKKSHPRNAALKKEWCASGYM